MWRGTTTTTPQGEQHPHPQQQRDTMEMARRVEALLRAALLRPALLGKRAVTVSGDVARRLSKAGQLRPARDCLVAALQALESMGTSGGWGGEGWKRTAQSALQWLLVRCVCVSLRGWRWGYLSISIRPHIHTYACTRQQSECYSQLGDTEKALSGLYALEALQKAEAAAAAAEEGGAGGGGAAAVIPVHKVSVLVLCHYPGPTYLRAHIRTPQTQNNTGGARQDRLPPPGRDHRGAARRCVGSGQKRDERRGGVRTYI